MATRASRWSSIRSAAGRPLKVLLDLVYPPKCALCAELLGGAASAGERVPGVCASCLLSVDAAGSGGRCERCDAVLGPGAEDRPQCSHCRALVPETPRLIVVGPYAGGLGAGVRALKFEGRVARARALGALLARRLKEDGGEPRDLICAVPSTRSRDRRRGFNHAGEIARELAACFGLPFAPGALTRLRETRPLVGLTRAERRTAVDGAFEACASDVAGRRVIVVDDVLTTGATLAACAGALRRAGAREVLGACVTRRHLE